MNRNLGPQFGYRDAEPNPEEYPSPGGRLTTAVVNPIVAISSFAAHPKSFVRSYLDERAYERGQR